MVRVYWDCPCCTVNVYAEHTYFAVHGSKICGWCTQNHGNRWSPTCGTRLRIEREKREREEKRKREIQERERQRVEAIRKKEQEAYRLQLRQQQEAYERQRKQRELEEQRKREEQQRQYALQLKRQREEAERQRKQRELEEKRRREEAQRQYALQLERQRKAKEAELKRQQQQYERQLKQTQIASLVSLKNQKSAERQRIMTYELSPVQAEVSKINNQILTEEKEIYKFSAERNDASHKLLILLGKTGDGKSTFGNRLCGDTSDMADKGPFATSDGDDSCTQLLKKAIYNKLSVVDCPGWGDTAHHDRTHTNNLCAYLRGCGGINAFIVVRNGSNYRFDAYFQEQLKYLASMFGDGFWKHLIVVLTRVDKGINEKQFQKANKANHMKQDVAKLCNNLNTNVPVIPIGLDNYKDKLAQIINAVPHNRFKPANIESPIDALKSKKNTLMNNKSAIQQRINSITNEMNNIDGQISNLRR